SCSLLARVADLWPPLGRVLLVALVCDRTVGQAGAAPHAPAGALDGELLLTDLLHPHGAVPLPVGGFGHAAPSSSSAASRYRSGRGWGAGTTTALPCSTCQRSAARTAVS